MLVYRQSRISPVEAPSIPSLLIFAHGQQPEFSTQQQLTYVALRQPSVPRDRLG